MGGACGLKGDSGLIGLILEGFEMNGQPPVVVGFLGKEIATREGKKRTKNTK